MRRFESCRGRAIDLGDSCSRKARAWIARGVLWGRGPHAPARRGFAGPDAEWRQRLRAAQAFAAATDPISQFHDAPDDELRAELLRGAALILGPTKP
ncbi:hypothetical protein [Kribbella sp. CA-294648]|uniref:hypothetical protein n=1 Tax=Kribbella sp. CA-294648 TaxID=3239948 RepID=UPI003D945DA1